MENSPRRLLLGASLCAALVVGCALDVPPLLPMDGCSGVDVPCGSVCQAPSALCEPVDFVGTYQLQIVSRANDCRLEGWEEGVVSAASTTIRGDGAELTATVDGIAGLLLTLGFGGEPVFRGTIEGDTLVATFIGTSARTEGGCSWFNTATLHASGDGNTFSGEIAYAQDTNGAPDCAPFRDTCSSIQQITASRPPR
ncbi:MAG: hypothetical protein AAF938_09430 [Myxococcota bacterium]